MIALVAVVLMAPAPAGPRTAVERFKAAPAEAADALAQAAEDAPLIADALRVLEAEARLAAGDEARALALARGVVAREPLWASRAAWVAARAESDCKGVMAWLDQVHPDPPWTTASATLALRVGTARRCADPGAAEAHARALALSDPDVAAAGRIEVELSPQELLQQAAGYERNRRYDKAMGVLAKLVDHPQVGLEARFARGQLQLERVRRDFHLAEADFAIVAQSRHALAEDAQYLVGRARGRRGDDAGAQAAYAEYAKRFPRGRHRADAEFFSAFAAYERGHFAVAAAAFEKIGRGSWRKAAAWYHAWSRYLAGDAGAEALLAAQARIGKPNSRAARRAAYWTARARETRDPAGAKRAYAALAAEQPHDWYGLFARRRHGGLPPLRALPTALSARAVQIPPAQVRAVAHIRALAAAGLDDFARRALSRIRATLAPDLLIRLAAEIGDAERQLRTAVRHGEKFVRTPQVADLAAWRAAYPRGFLGSVSPWAARRGLPAWLIYSFIRKESAFDVDAVSHAHAIGLMQLLTRTADAALAGDGGTPPANLFDADTNVRLGTWYVAALSRRYHGQFPILAGAYNAGPGPMNDWLASIDTQETDVFVDRIPFREAREYIKLMARTGVVYQLLYDGVDLDEAAEAIPSTLRRDVAAGVEF